MTPPKCLRTYRGGEFSSKFNQEILYRAQVNQEFTGAIAHQQNGVAERYNRVITELTRGLLAENNLGASNVDNCEVSHVLYHI